MMRLTSSVNRKNSSRGFSLIELMVAMTIGLILTIGVVQIFSASRSTYQLDEGLARAQENGRFAIEFMSREIRHAAHLGCRRNVSVFNNLAGSGSLYTVSGVFGHEFNTPTTGPGSTYAIPANPANTLSGWSPGLPAGVTLAAGALPGSDIIGIERFTPTPINIAMPTTRTPILMVSPAEANLLKVDDIVMITDCQKATIFQITNVDTGTGAISHDIGGNPPGNRCGVWENNVAGSTNAAGDACIEQVYEPNAMLGQVATVYFFVARGAAPDNRPTLYQNVVVPGSLPPRPVPLVEGVENIQILYGVDDTIPPDGLPERYVPANSVVNLTTAVSIRLGVLVNSVTTVGTVTDQALDADTYNVAGTTIDPQDDKLKRRVFTTTIQLRNRGI
jgi:type IV pilus assembly protein PilW